MSFQLADFVHFPELQRSDGHRTADSAARQDHHLCQSPQEQHHGPGVPGTGARVASYAFSPQATLVHPTKTVFTCSSEFRFSCVTGCVSVLLQALVMKVGMDSIMASYFALFEVINHSFGKNRRLPGGSSNRKLVQAVAVS